MSSEERRLAQRKKIAVPLRFHVSTSAQGETFTGETVNLSERGIYFTVNHLLDVGAPLEMYFVIPQELTGRKSEEVRCTGRVIHVHPGVGRNGLTGIGARIEHFEPVGGAPKWSN